MKKIPFKRLAYGFIAILIVFLGISFLGDNEPPQIVPLNQTIEYGTELSFSELASVEDNSSEEIQISILSSDMSGATYDDDTQIIVFHKIGNYEIKLSATDEAGNTSQDIVLIKVVDKTPPTIESEQEEFSLAEADEEGAYFPYLTAYDEVDGDLSGNIEIDDSEVKYGEIGDYKIKAVVSDCSGNTCTQFFKVTIKDTTAPVLNFTKTSFSLTEGANTPDYMKIVTANDIVDGDITESIVIDDSKVNYNSAGTYEVIYKATDNSGNSATQKISVTIKEKKSNSSSYSGSIEVMITRTGECYHTHKCGNGNYFWVSFSEAQSRGLRACNKCY